MDKKPNSKRNKINLAFISPYSDLAQVFSRLVNQEDINPYVSLATLADAADIARNIRSQTDVILSRGGTAEYIKEAVDIPVISIPITTFDVARAIFAVKNRAKEIAFFNFSQKMYGVRELENMFSVKILEYTFATEKEIEDGIRASAARGIKMVIGGVVAVKLAQKYSMESILIECGEEAVSRSISEAIHVAQVRRVERSRVARVKIVLDSIAEGIVVTDETNCITIYNPAAERIFRIPENQAIGQKVQDIIPNTRMHLVFESGKPDIDALQELYGITIATNRIPIMLDDKRIGVVSTFQDITKIQHLEQQIRKKIYDKGFLAKNNFSNILTRNVHMQELKEIAALYARTDSSVLIQGESGTGKELFAQSIHNASKRKTGPFVAINCAAIPESLLENELFGYEGGAFTGARKEGKPGLFELAHRGTIFLDEIGEIPRTLQARLLRVLQEKEIMRLSGDKIIPVDTRVISATNKNLEKKVEQGDFRDDLYYRLNIFDLKIPPLRDRKEDILLLVSYFLSKFNPAINYDKVIYELKPFLIGYDWPGNIRELSNIMERLSLLFTGMKTKLSLVEMLRKVMHEPLNEGASITVRVSVDKGLKSAVHQIELYIINRMLEMYNNDQASVAKKLGIGLTTLWRKSKGVAK